MAEGDIGAVLDTQIIDTGTGVSTKLIHVDGLIWAAVYETPDTTGWIKTVSISEDGLTLALAGGSLHYDLVAGTTPDIIHISDDIYAVVYQGPDGDGWIKTVSISADGTTVALAGGSLEFDASDGLKPIITPISGDIYAIAYEDYGYDGTIITVSISADGATIAAAGGSLIYDDVKGTGGRLVRIAGEVYAVVYGGPDFDGWIKTVTISADGATVALAGGSLEFDEVHGASPYPIEIAPGIFAIAYQGPDTDGWIKAVSISDDGLTLALAGGSLEFDVAQGQFPSLTHISGNVYALPYTGVGSDGFLTTLSISEDGATIAIADGPDEFDADNGREAMIHHVANSVYAIIYGGTGGAPTLKTIAVETIPPSGGAGGLMMMGIG